MSAEDFNIQTEVLSDRGIVVVSLTGYLDAHTFERLENTIYNELFPSKQYKLVVDLTNVDYISSAGAGVFIGALSEAQENKGNIVLLNPTANVREVFDLLGLTTIFPVVDDRAAALAVFK